jgi:protein-S-isoprenylcysteine O-methyltransferase Ste14
MDVPGTTIAATVTAYWLGIGVMIVRVRRHTHRMAGVVPGQSVERLMWLAWLPLAALWITLPWLALERTDGLLALPAFARAPGYVALRWSAALIGLAALVATVKCWARMGKDWRMAVTDEPDQHLITDGLYGRIRHPIYAFSILLVLASVIGVPTLGMALVGVCLVALWVGKAHNEERHLLRQHGEDYARYLSRTGRFLPRFR